MPNKSTFIKLDRNIQNWRWYQNANTFRVFIHCLLNANIAPRDWEGITINRGEFPTSYDKIANTLNLTNQQIRTAINHLKSTGEITTKVYSKFQVISIVNYNYYQDGSTGKSTGNQQAVNIQLTVKQQQLKNNEEYINNDKEVCNEKSELFSPPTFDDVLQYAIEKGREDLAKPFYEYFEAGDWIDSEGKRVRSWKQKFLTWRNKSEKKSEEETKEKSFDDDEFFAAAVARAKRMRAERTKNECIE